MWRESASLIIAAKSNFSQTSVHNFKILCLQRSKESGFMPGAYVFPGGNISESDCSIKWLDIFKKFGYNLESFRQLYPNENVPQILKTSDGENCLPRYLSLRICAIRETFEECGILICRCPKVNYKEGTNWASYFGGHEILNWQHKVHYDSKEFLNLCSQFEIYPDVWSLQNWSNWMTPPSLRIRFNTMFFSSTFHQIPDVHKDDKEIQNLKWATPSEFLCLNDKEVTFPVPQFYELSRLRNFSNIQNLSEYSKTRSNYGCVRYFPYKVITDEGLYNIFPGDEMYPNFVDKSDTDVPVLKTLPTCVVQNRVLISKDHRMRLFVKNLVPGDKHLLPVQT